MKSEIAGQREINDHDLMLDEKRPAGQNDGMAKRRKNKKSYSGSFYGRNAKMVSRSGLEALYSDVLFDGFPESRPSPFCCRGGLDGRRRVHLFWAP